MVPEHRNAPYVYSLVFGLAAVVHAMYRWRVEQSIQDTEPTDRFRVDPGLIVQNKHLKADD